MKKTISFAAKPLGLLSLDQELDLKISHDLLTKCFEIINTHPKFSELEKQKLAKILQKINNTLYQSSISQEKLDAVIQELKASVTAAEKDVPRFMAHYLKELELGLAGKSAYFRMNPTYLYLQKQKLKPQEVYAIDLGGSTLRLMQLKIKEGTAAPEIGFVREVALDKKFKTVKEVKVFFDLLAKELKQMLVEEKIDLNQKFKIGFAFSFNFEYLKNGETKLLAWSKGFSASDAVGKDPRQFMEQALINHGVNANLNVIANDAATTLVAGHELANADLSLIMGTSTNMAIELPKTKFKKEILPYKSRKMIVNLDSASWFYYDQEKFSTKFDSQIKDFKNKDNSYKLGKLYTGSHLGSLFGVLLKTVSNIKHQEHPLNSDPAFLGKLLSEISKLEVATKEQVNQLFTKYGLALEVPDNLTAEKIKELSLLLFERAALAAAVFIASTVKYLDPYLKKAHVVACDGSVYQHNPVYQKAIAAKLQAFGCEKVMVKNIENASSLGAALLACGIRNKLIK